MLHPLIQAKLYHCRHCSMLIVLVLLYCIFLCFLLLMNAKLYQLMFSKFEYDGKLNPTFAEGAFQLPVSSIKAYMKEPITPRFNIPSHFPKLVHILWFMCWKAAFLLEYCYAFLILWICSNCRFVHVSSAGVTRPERPGLDLSKQPPAVRLNKELGFILTFKLKVSYHLNASVWKSFSCWIR